jgi:hypothetical protein
MICLPCPGGHEPEKGHKLLLAVIAGWLAWVLFGLVGCATGTEFHMEQKPSIPVYSLHLDGLHRRGSTGVMSVMSGQGFQCVAPEDMETILLQYCAPRCGGVPAR